jgi:DNA-binding response OmpR family regulator
MRILIIEDDAAVRSTIRTDLTGAGHAVTVSGTGEEGLALARSRAFDLVLLDIGLPGMTGLEVATTLRQQGDTTPIIFLSGRDSEEEIVEGLDLGADGYVTKPFSMAELRARLRALERRRSMDMEHRLAFQGLEMDPRTREASFQGKRLSLTDVEFRLLAEIVSGRGEIRTRAHLLNAVWRIDFDPQTGLLDVHMSNLRKKLAKAGPAFIETVRGVGYRAVGSGS